ncbi:MAG: glycosyltransferase family 2 protein [Acidobacteria bacterium]|nr:glycosyltransferase family 2 protein [Acidobacteriota bacterium]
MKILRGSRPTFSIIIPTYNRAHLLPLAVKSVLHQTFDDFEIVISNGGSTDNTREVVAEFADPRIRYFESDSRLPVSENYQKGFDNATGEYITFLSDDDAYVPELLSSVKTVIDRYGAEIVGYDYCTYFHSETTSNGRKIAGNTLVTSPSSGKVTLFSKDQAIDQVLARFGLRDTSIDPSFACPYLSNATYRRTVFEELLKKRPNLFNTVPPDMYLSVAVFFAATSYHCLDKQLLVWSNWEENSTASVERSKSNVRKHYERLLGDKTLEHTPIKTPLALNCTANAILEALADHDPDGNRVDWGSYFVAILENISFLKSLGIDVSTDEKEFEQVLADQPEAVRLHVSKFVSSPIYKIKAILFALVPAVGRQIRAVVTRHRFRTDVISSGEDEGFSDILGACRFVS